MISSVWTRQGNKEFRTGTMVVCKKQKQLDYLAAFEHVPEALFDLDCGERGKDPVLATKHIANFDEGRVIAVEPESIGGACANVSGSREAVWEELV